MNRKNPIFASHESFRDASNSICMECGWYGDKDELLGTESTRCPDCGDLTYENEAYGMGEDELEAFVAELSAQAIIFNRKFGHGVGDTRDERRFNAMVEIDMHGYLIFRVLDWQKFCADRSNTEYYVINGGEINVNNPDHFSVAKARDLLWDFEIFAEKADS